MKEIPTVKFEMDYKKSWEKAVSKIYDLQEENEMLNNECDTYMKIATKKQERIDKAIEYITSYEAIETIQQFDHRKNNEDLDGATIDEMTRRYLEVHDKLLNILQGEDTK